MSNKHKREILTRQVVEDFLRCSCPSKFKGERLSKVDDRTFKLALQLQAYLILDITSDRVPNRDHRILPWLRAIGSCDVHELASFFKSANVLIRRYVEHERYDYKCFKHTFREAYPWVGDVMSPIKEEMERFLSTPNPSDFAVLNQFFSFITRVTFADVDHSNDALAEYRATEERLSNFVHDYSLYKSLNGIIREWFSDFTYEEFIPKHGKGAVAGFPRISIDEKYRLMGSDTLTNFFLRRLGLRYEDISPIKERPFERTCEVIFVPKSMLTFRTISKEPAVLQYLQQGIWSSLDKFLRHHAFLHKRVHIHDQSFNRDRACLGSVTGQYATIDLSSASDCVSWELAKSLFAGTPILCGMYATRSRFAHLPNKEVIALKKYAPMGSALCFPIECIIFAAICELASRNPDAPSSHSDYMVYGDDLVVPIGTAKRTVEILSLCGFLVNSSKTFFNPHNPFRESCGGEYYLGVDVTPIRLSRNFSAKPMGKHHPNLFQSYIDLANMAYRYNLRNLRAHIVRELLALKPMFYPRFTFDSTQLQSNTASNFHLRRIYFDWWQEELVNYGQLSTVGDDENYHPDDLSETIRLFEWFRLSIDRDRLEFPEDRISTKIGRTRVELISVLGLMT